MFVARSLATKRGSQLTESDIVEFRKLEPRQRFFVVRWLSDHRYRDHVQVLRPHVGITHERQLSEYEEWYAQIDAASMEWDAIDVHAPDGQPDESRLEKAKAVLEALEAEADSETVCKFGVLLTEAKIPAGPFHLHMQPAPPVAMPSDSIEVVRGTTVRGYPASSPTTAIGMCATEACAQDPSLPFGPALVRCTQIIAENWKPLNARNQ